MKSSWLLAGVAALSLLTACGGDKPKTYTSDQAGIDECVSDGNTRDVCTDAISHAKEDADKVAPHYSAMDQCIADYGADRCISHGDYWGPVLTGFMLGTLVNGSHSYGYPVYINRTGGMYTNYDVVHHTVIRDYSWRRPPAPIMSYTPSRTMATRIPVTATVTHTTISRGGFGGGSTVVHSSSVVPRASISSPSVSRGGFGGGGFHSFGRH
jgi:uncharacterized protein YgiB involved in biofilm formation